MSGDGIQAGARAQGVTVLHLPQGVNWLPQRVAQSVTEISQSVELTILGLALAVAERRAVVALDGGSASGNGTCRALRMIVLIAGYAMLRGHLIRSHFQEVELRRHLK